MNQTRNQYIRSKESIFEDPILKESIPQTQITESLAEPMNTKQNIEYHVPIDRAILFITFYGLVDYVDEIVNEFESICAEDQYDNYKYSVHWYPYLKYVNDLNMTSEKMSIHLVRTIRDKNITHVFWLFLPENAAFYEAIRRDVPHIKFIFYNFDDLKNFNVVNLNIANHMDYFIQPSQVNQQKYSLILKNNVFFIPHYVHVDMICLQCIESTALDMYEHYPTNPEIDCIVIVEDTYSHCDVVERDLLNKYILKIKNAMIDNNHSFKLYGDSELENIYPDIYEDQLDVMNEGNQYTNTKCVVILDVTDGINKDFGRKIIHASLNNKKIFTNSFGLNRYAHKFIPDTESQVLCMTDMDPLIRYIEGVKINKLNITNKQKDNQKHNIKNWVSNILNLISSN